ncbi:zinc ribbon domain-containing protein [Kribbella sp. NPDC048915]|uniref:zinc ribbon domain-containing protein n=1 Tax=Kribbella sp. NPDC048915 TaxID=3155148 RepID=UPI0033CD2467
MPSLEGLPEPQGSAEPPPVARLAAPVVEREDLAEVEPQPVKARPAPVRRATPSSKLNPGDLICGDCGEGNAPDRKFCRRCGHSLASAEVVKTPWWRRLRRRRRPRTMVAGSRPARPGESAAPRVFRTALRRVRAAVGILMLTFVLLSGLYPPLRTYVVQQASNVKQKISGVAESALAPIRPAAVQGSKATVGHPPKAAFDTFTNTTWAAPWNQKTPPTLTDQLDHAVALRKVIVSNGDKKNFAALIRPATLQFRYSNEQTELITLADTPEPQEFTLRNGIGVNQLTVIVVSVYPAQGARDLALSEIELFGIG